MDITKLVRESVMKKNLTLSATVLEGKHGIKNLEFSVNDSMWTSSPGKISYNRDCWERVQYFSFSKTVENLMQITHFDDVEV